MSKGQAKIHELQEEVKSLKRQLEEAKESISRNVEICQQMMCDAFAFAVHDIAGISKGRMEVSMQTFNDRHFEIATLIRKDVYGEGENPIGDPEFIYAQTKIDRELKEIVPDHLWCPWNERYYNSTQFRRIKRSRESLLRQAAMYDAMAKICREEAKYDQG